MSLTRSQQTAVVYDQNLIIFAGPGSGKTSTFIQKGRRILSMQDTVLGMVTFTTAAANEMGARMRASASKDGVQIPSNRLRCGTFHAMALKHYQRHARNPKKLIAPPARSALISSMLKDYSLEERSIFTLQLEHYQGSLTPDLNTVDPEIATFIQNYLSKLQAAHSTDLATIMRDCTLMMRDGSIPLLGVSHLLGDEMQDADEVQLAFMLAHSAAGVTTTLVADDDQTIYEWRNALGYAGLQHFAREAGAKTITLAENFRSRSEIVDHATRLIAFNDPDRIPKNQLAVRGPGGRLAVQSFGSAADEAKGVAETIEAHRAADESVAVLARTNRSLDSIEEALSAKGIAYARDSASLWATPEVATLLSLLKSLLTGATSDLLPALMLLELDAPLRKEMEISLGASCASFLDGEIPSLKRATAADVAEMERFAALSARWRADIAAGHVNMMLPNVSSSLRAMFKVHHAERTDGSARMRRIGTLLTSATAVLTKLDGLLSQRLAKISQLQKGSADPAAVRLLTMHSSKGLEFDTVFLVDATHPDDGSTLMEDQPERRLFYVALTRARERFLVAYSGTPVKYVEEAALPFCTTFAEVYGPVVP